MSKLYYIPQTEDEFDEMVGSQDMDTVMSLFHNIHLLPFEFKRIPGFVGPREIWEIFPNITYAEVFKMYGVTDRSVDACITMAKMKLSKAIDDMPTRIELEMWRKKYRQGVINIGPIDHWKPPGPDNWEIEKLDGDFNVTSYHC